MEDTVRSAPAPVQEQLVLFKDKILVYHNDLKVHREKQKRLTAMLKESLTEDDEYRMLLEEQTQVKVKLDARLKKLMADPELIKLNDDIEHGKQEGKDIQQTLSDYLESYHKKSGEYSFEDNDGTKIVIKRKFSMKKTTTKRGRRNK